MKLDPQAKLPASFLYLPVLKGLSKQTNKQQKTPTKIL